MSETGGAISSSPKPSRDLGFFAIDWLGPEEVQRGIFFGNFPGKFREKRENCVIFAVFLKILGH
jgi:hypothetical protein